MQVTLFKALKSIKIDNATATLVVEQLENFMKTKMEESTKGLEAQLKAQTWLIGSIGIIIAASTVAAAIKVWFN